MLSHHYVLRSYFQAKRGTFSAMKAPNQHTMMHKHLCCACLIVTDWRLLWVLSVYHTAMLRQEADPMTQDVQIISV